MDEIRKISKEIDFINLTYYFKGPNITDSRQKVIDLFNDYAKIRSEAIYETKQDGRGLKILTPK